jgi:hypothetical protein
MSSTPAVRAINGYPFLPVIFTRRHYWGNIEVSIVMLSGTIDPGQSASCEVGMMPLTHGLTK